MNSDELKELIGSSIEPLLQRIIALENDNQEIKALLKNVPQNKVQVKPIPQTSASSTFIESLDIKKVPPTSSKNLENEKNVGLEKKSENGLIDINKTPSNQKKEPITKPVNPTTAVKRPVTAQTPQNEKKPITNPPGRVSIGADKHKPLIKPVANSNHPNKNVDEKQEHETKTEKKEAEAAKQKNGTSKGGLVPHKVEPSKNKTTTSNKNLKVETTEKVEKQEEEKKEKEENKEETVEVSETKVEVPEPVQATDSNVEQKEAESTVEKGEISEDNNLENKEKHEEKSSDNLDETASKDIPEVSKEPQAEEQEVSS